MTFVSKDNVCGCGLLSPGLASTLVICVMYPLLCVMLREENCHRETLNAHLCLPGCDQIFIS